MAAECCQSPARRSQVLALLRLLPLVTTALLVGEIFSTDDILRASRCAAPPDSARPACASPSTLLTARYARLIT